MGLFTRKNTASAELSARQLAERLHDAGRTDQQIADAIGASRAQVTKIRNGSESGALLRPRLLALAEGKEVVPRLAAQRPVRQAKVAPPRKPPRRPSEFGITRPRAAPAPSRSPLPSASSHALTSDDIGEPVSIHGQQFGWIGPNGRPTKHPPERAVTTTPAQSMAATRSPRRQQLDAYQALRARGLSERDAQEALAVLAPSRQPSTPTPEPDFGPFLDQAEQDIRSGNNAGMWQTKDIVERAKALARQAAAQRQVPRQADHEPLQIAAPGAQDAAPLRADGARAHGQQALPIWMGADYAARAALREYLQQQIAGAGSSERSTSHATAHTSAYP